MNVAPGNALSHYRLLEKIGEGGMGAVWKAHDLRLDRDVALKVLLPELLPDDAARRRFRKEAAALSRLNHPNIETVFDFDIQDGVDFLVMEFVPGVTLDRMLASGPLPEKDIARLGTQLGEALAAAHARGVLHRDLKPGNLRVTPDGRLKVLDFGLAKLLPSSEPGSSAETMTETRGLVGTLPYMAPEQLRGGPSDARADLYAAGVVLYEMATGRRPFQDKVATALTDAILHKPPPPPGRLATEISSRLEEVILKCLEKDPERRYQSAAELLVDLRRLGTASSADTGKAAAGPAPLWRRMLGAWPLTVALALIAVAATGYLFRWYPASNAAHPAGRAMLAVLPFDNLSGDPEQEYFSDGMTEEMIAQLGQLAPHDLGVIARTSAMHYKGTRERIDEIGRALGAQYILEGSVRRASGRVRITAQLIQAGDQTHLWAESYERDAGEIFAIQTDVARRIAASLALELLPAAKERPAGVRAIDPAAHDAYLRGLYFLNTREPEKIALAIEQLEKAVSLEPTYALAYAALGDAYGVLTQHGTVSSREAEEALERKASAAIRRAFELDPNLAEAHLEIAEERFFKEFDWPGAEDEYLRTIQLSPNSALAHHYYATFLWAMRRFDEALTENEKAFQLDPLGPWTADLAANLAQHGRDDEAIKKYREALELSPGLALARRQLGMLYLRKGMIDEAIAELSIDLVGRGKGDEVPSLQQAIRNGGRKGYHCWRLESLKQTSEQQYVSSTDLAFDAAGCGRNDEAMSWLEKAYQEREWQLFRLGAGPAFDDLRSDPRFRDLMRRLRLPTD